MNLERVYRYIDENVDSFVEDLVRLVKWPSVSAKGEGIEDCAKLVEEMMHEAGLSTKILRNGKGNPVVYGAFKSRKTAKTFPFYNHYDVQPPEPLESGGAPPSAARLPRGRFMGGALWTKKGTLSQDLRPSKP